MCVQIIPGKKILRSKVQFLKTSVHTSLCWDERLCWLLIEALSLLIVSDQLIDAKIKGVKEGNMHGIYSECDMIFKKVTV